jgi:hypothetical protein
MILRQSLEALRGVPILDRDTDTDDSASLYLSSHVDSAQCTSDDREAFDLDLCMGIAFD